MRKGKNLGKPYSYTGVSMKRKSAALAKSIDKYIEAALHSGNGFKHLVDFNKLHKIKDDLIELSQIQL